MIHMNIYITNKLIIWLLFVNYVFLNFETSILPLLDILRSESKIVSDTNATRIHVNIITQARHQIVFDYVGILEINMIKQHNVLKYVVCYYMSFQSYFHVGM